MASPPGVTDVVGMTSLYADMVRGAGQIGCGLEAPLEAMYRFLADPNPYGTIAVKDNQITKQGTDDVLLQQRKAFLRADSALVVLVLTDENDCSIREYSSFYLAGQAAGGYHLPRARAICSSDPGNACCASCGQSTPEGCEEDPTCDGTLSGLEDPISLRCFDEKRRFGLDFLYPVERYVNALTKPTIDPGTPELDGSQAVPNPIYSDLSNSGSNIRSRELVFMAGIVGVPWQLLARNPNDLSQGYLPGPSIAWDRIVGDPAIYSAPLDPHMVESIDPRPGLPMTMGDPLTGGERTILARDDLQYACIFDLPESLDCTTTQQCDCQPGNDSPLCTGPDNTVQVKGAAYPGLRTLSVLRGLGEQGVVGSICPATLDTTNAAFGYRAAMAAIGEAVRPAMAK